MAKPGVWSARKTASAARNILSPFPKAKYNMRGVKRAGFDVHVQDRTVVVSYWALDTAQDSDRENSDWLARYKRLLEDRLPSSANVIQYSGREYDTPCILITSRD